MNIAGVVVTFEPDFETLSKLLKALKSQVNKVVIVDNGSKVSHRNRLFLSDITFIDLACNYGIAYAQNVGITRARDLGATHVLIMDQDSIPLTNMVKFLSDAFIKSGKTYGESNIAAVGSLFIDPRSNKNSFFVIEKNHFPSRWVAEKHLTDFPYVEAMFLISSGTLIPLNVIESLGGMRSNYFIDHVDTEWSFRARANGYKLIGVPCAQMYHSLGDHVKSIRYFGERQISYHSPLRDYYMFRKTLLMINDVKINMVWKLYMLWRLFQFAGYFLLFSSERKRRLNCMTLGIYHGISGISGKLDLNLGKTNKIPQTELDPN